MANYKVIMHYASEYYDPVKAHEYYMQHRKLKGRSTSSLNDAGKEAAEYVKKNLQEKRDRQINQSKANMQSKIDSSKEQMTNTIAKSKTEMENSINEHKSNMENKISMLQARIKSLKGNNTESRTLAIRKEILKLRNDNAAKKDELRAAYQLSSASARNNHKLTTASARDEHKTNSSNYRDEYESNYAAELDKILADPSMLKAKKSSSSKNTSSASVNTSKKSLSEINELMKKYKNSKRK